LRQRWLLAVLVAGQFMANVDIAIVNVATPSIHRDLHASGSALEFVARSGFRPGPARAHHDREQFWALLNANCSRS